MSQTYKYLSQNKVAAYIFKHITCTQIRNVCIENMVIVLQNNCTTEINIILVIVITSMTSFTYNNITYLYNGPYI